jgi:hypothetical protein
MSSTSVKLSLPLRFIPFFRSASCLNNTEFQLHFKGWGFIPFFRNFEEILKDGVINSTRVNDFFIAKILIFFFLHSLY